MFDSLPLVSIEGVINPANAFTYHLFRTHFNVILPSAPRPSPWSCPIGLPIKILWAFFFSLRMPHIPPVSHSLISSPVQYLGKNVTSKHSRELVRYVMPGVLVVSPIVCKLFVFFVTRDLDVIADVNIFCEQLSHEFIPLPVKQAASTDNYIY